LRRSTLVAFHRWVGLIFGLFLFVQGLTGVAIVFRDDLNRALHHEAMTVAPSGAPLPMQQLLEVVRKAHPEGDVLRIDYPKRPTDAVYFRVENRDHSALRFVSVDPYRGLVTRDGTLSAWPVQWLFELHQELLVGDVGENLVGITGLALLCITLTAPFVWWPGRRQLKRSLGVTLKAGAYRGFRDLHRVGGILIVIVLFCSATTGLITIYRKEIQPVVAAFAPIHERPAPKVAKRADVPLLPLDQIVADARNRYGGSPVRNVRFPGGSGRVVVVYLEPRGTDRPRASDQLWFNAYTGEVLGKYEAASLPGGNLFFDWMLPIHTGQAFGIVGRVIFLSAALLLSGLALTGFLQWLLRRKLMRSKRSPAARHMSSSI
jgi:uncharacterized iron-regulated membrane protein